MAFGVFWDRARGGFLLSIRRELMADLEHARTLLAGKPAFHLLP